MKIKYPLLFIIILFIITAYFYLTREKIDKYDKGSKITNLDFSNFSFNALTSLCFWAKTFAFGIFTPPY